MIIVYNNKGGVGKTTAAVHLFLWLMCHMDDDDEPWCLLDLDEQNNSMSWLAGHEWEGETLSFSDDSSLLGCIATDEIEVAQEYENIIIDAPPRSDFVEMIVEHFDLDPYDIIIVPVVGRFSIDGAIKVIKPVAR